MALEQGDSQVAQAPEGGSGNMGNVAADSQVGAAPQTDDVKAANDDLMASLNMGKSEDFFGSKGNGGGDKPQEDKDDDDQDQEQENFAPPQDKSKEPNLDIKEPDTTGKENDLSDDKHKELNDLRSTAQDTYDDGGWTADVQQDLQKQADQYGTNPDGSNKVNIHAFQTNDSKPQTSFYATFGNTKSEQDAAQFLVEGSRQYGTPFPSDRAGYIGTMAGRTGPRI